MGCCVSSHTLFQPDFFLTAEGTLLQLKISGTPVISAERSVQPACLPYTPMCLHTRCLVTGVVAKLKEKGARQLVKAFS